VSRGQALELEGQLSKNFISWQVDIKFLLKDFWRELFQRFSSPAINTKGFSTLETMDIRFAFLPLVVNSAL